MPTLSIALTGAGANDRTVSKTVSAAHLTRFVDAYRVVLGQVVDDPGDPDNGIPPTYRDRTDQEVYDAWANGLFAGTRDQVLRQEQIDASKTASDAVTPIDLS